MSDQEHSHPMLAEISDPSGIGWAAIMQMVNFLVLVGLFALAARAILARGRGWEVPVWLLLAFLIPLMGPIIALIHFRKARVGTSPFPAKGGRG